MCRVWLCALCFSLHSWQLWHCWYPHQQPAWKPVESSLHLVQSPFGIFAFSESFPFYWIRTTPSRKGQLWKLETLSSYWEFCLKNTYFSFQGQFYEQVEGAAMGSPVSPIVANLYMEYLEQKVLSTAPHPPRFWHRYVDDTFVIHKEANKQGFLQHINSVDPAIRFTVEDNKEDGSIPFLDTIVKPEVDGSLSIAVFRKPTHTDQYLQWDSNHHLSAKLSVIQTLSHRASTVCSNPELLQKEKDHLRKALTKCKYPKWALDRVEGRLNRFPGRLLMGAPTMPKLPTVKWKTKGT